MEHSLLPRTLWTNDSKFLHHHAPDFFTSVQVTQDIPAGVSFGPCALHNTFYDTIAFIALKSFDRGGKAYVFRVDPDALKSSPLVVPWLRLVQAAIDTEEQNTEAYLKGGQLFFRTIRDINQGEELLVWYDEDLSHLLGFNDIKTTALTDGYSCGKCGLAFKHEHPFLAHCRFLCAHVATLRVDSEQKHAETRRLRSVTDFHNIARELEHKNKKSGSSEDRKRRHEEALSPRCRKPVLLEKKNIPNNNNNNITHTHKVGPRDQEATIRVASSLTSENVKNSAFAETKKAKSEQPSKSEDISRENPDVCSLQSDRQAAFGLQSESSAFLVWSPNAEQRSAFCKPNKLSINEDRQHQRPIVFSDDASEHTALGYRNTPSLLFQSDLPSTPIVSPASMSAPGSFHYAPDVWCRNIGGPLQTTSSLSILPPTLNSLGVTVQNWCAKCNLSFRMTSDLVFHMRSHHKKEFAAEAQGRRRREEKLTCPICHEYFRERHHLSRHMTSHN